VPLIRPCCVSPSPLLSFFSSFLRCFCFFVSVVVPPESFSPSFPPPRLHPRLLAWNVLFPGCFLGDGTFFVGCSPVLTNISRSCLGLPFLACRLPPPRFSFSLFIFSPRTSFIFSLGTFCCVGRPPLRFSLTPFVVCGHPPKTSFLRKCLLPFQPYSPPPAFPFPGDTRLNLLLPPK